MISIKNITKGEEALVENFIEKLESTIKEMLKSLSLVYMSLNLEDQIKIAVDKKLSHREFLENLLKIERLGKSKLNRKRSR